MIKSISIVVTLLLFASVAVKGQNERSVLRGLSPITSVVIEGLPSDAKSGGLSADQLQTDVELRLRKAGIRISNSADSFLYVNVHVIKTAPCNGFAVAPMVEFNRLGTLEIGKGEKSTEVISVWSKRTLLTASPSSFERSTRDSIGDLVDRFLNDFLAANPKP